MSLAYKFLPQQILYFLSFKKFKVRNFYIYKKKERRRGDTVIHNYTRVGFHKNCLFLCFKIFLNIYIYTL
jgi:hypothetical protein